jgi:hypothetical protein
MSVIQSGPATGSEVAWVRKEFANWLKDLTPSFLRKI